MTEESPGRGRTSALEWFAAAIGLALILGTAAVIGREALTAETAQLPAIDVKILRIVPVGSGFVVEFEAINRSSATAAAVEIEGVSGDPADPIETSGVTLDFLAGDSRSTGGLIFARDPRTAPLVVCARGFQTP